MCSVLQHAGSTHRPTCIRSDRVLSARTHGGLGEQLNNRNKIITSRDRELPCGVLSHNRALPANPPSPAMVGHRSSVYSLRVSVWMGEQKVEGKKKKKGRGVGGRQNGGKAAKRAYEEWHPLPISRPGDTLPSLNSAVRRQFCAEASPATTSIRSGVPGRRSGFRSML